jgi:hypothetical protein
VSLLEALIPPPRTTAVRPVLAKSLKTQPYDQSVAIRSTVTLAARSTSQNQYDANFAESMLRNKPATLRARLARKLQLSTFTGGWNGPRPRFVGLRSQTSLDADGCVPQLLGQPQIRPFVAQVHFQRDYAFMIRVNFRPDQAIQDTVAVAPRLGRDPLELVTWDGGRGSYVGF